MPSGCLSVVKDTRFEDHFVVLLCHDDILAVASRTVRLRVVVDVAFDDGVAAVDSIPFAVRDVLLCGIFVRALRLYLPL